MRAIFIDSVNKQVTEITLDTTISIIDQWYKILNVSMVEVACHIDFKNSIIVDEEGMLKPCNHFFNYDGAHQPFAGSGLIVGVDDEGETISCDLSLDEVKSKVTFMSFVDVINNIF